MSPRTSYGEQPMTSAERVWRARWANKVEETAFKLTELLTSAPTPLPRSPAIPFELLDLLKPLAEVPPNDQALHEVERVLQRGNGNQTRNKKKAMRFVAKFFKAKVIDNGTLETKAWGLCHVAAYTHEKGAMISTPNRETGESGGRDWHSRDHIIMFRDLGDGNCKLYVSKIAPLFEHRTIGRGGVTWENVEKLCVRQTNLTAVDVLKELGYMDDDPIKIQGGQK